MFGIKRTWSPRVEGAVPPHTEEQKAIWAKVVSLRESINKETPIGLGGKECKDRSIDRRGCFACPTQEGCGKFTNALLKLASAAV